MNWFMQKWQELTCRYKKGFLTFIICILLFIITTSGTWAVTKNLFDQQAAERWSSETEYAQLSCFYPISKSLSDFEFQSLHHAVADGLKKASMEAESEDVKLFVDACSVSGTINIASPSHEMEVSAVGVSDNFFLFHPVTLLQGAYFDEHMIMKDGVILDEEAAFQLYGSNDVVGMPLYIGNAQFYVRGVVKKADGYFAKKAGLTASTCYVAVETLEKYGTTEGSYTYEVVMPNPVDDFATGIIKSALNDTEQKIEVVENSTRFSFDAKKDVVLDFGTRSMSRNSIIYPYWENIARACEDVCGILFIIQTVSALIAAGLLIIYLWKQYKERKWSLRGIWERIQKMWKSRRNILKKQ